MRFLIFFFVTLLISPSANATQPLPQSVKAVWDEFFERDREKPEGTSGKLRLREFERYILYGDFEEATKRVSHNWSTGELIFGKTLAQRSMVTGFARYQLSSLRQICPSEFNQYVAGKVSFLPNDYTIEQTVEGHKITTKSNSAFVIFDVLIMRSKVGCRGIGYYARNAVTFVNGGRPIFLTADQYQASPLKGRAVERACRVEWKDYPAVQTPICTCIQARAEQHLPLSTINAFKTSWGAGVEHAMQNGQRRVWLYQVFTPCTDPHDW